MPMVRFVAPRIRHRHVLRHGAVALLLAACGGDAPTEAPAPPVAVATVRIAPLADLPVVGETVRLAVTTLDSTGTVLTGRAVTYWSTNAGVVTIAPDGVLTANAAGGAIIRVTSEGRTASLAVTVLTERAAALLVAPAMRTVVPGATLQIGAQLRAEGGAVLPSGGVIGEYVSSNPAVARVDANGIVTAVAPGRAEVSVRVGRLTTPVVVVVEPSPASAFRIMLVPGTETSAELLAVVQRAAARWERVIVGALPAVRVSLGAGSCAEGTPAISETLTDLTIFVQIDSIDGRGGILGMAGPCVVRPASQRRLPVIGVMWLDRHDLQAMLQSGTAEDVVLHEMGHVLGIGTLWYDLVEGDVDPRFAGVAARDAAGRSGFFDDAARGVAIEDQGPPGTRGAHWRERDFRSELMTGWVSSGIRNPMSLVTVGAMRDLGYEVHEGGADDFSDLVPLGTGSGAGGGLGARRQASEAPRTRVVEEVLAPRFQVDEQGRLTRWSARIGGR